MSSPTAETRNQGLDALRAALTLLVIFHHTAITYGGSGGWYYRERGLDGSASSLLLTLLCAVDQSYFMGLFFLLAGTFTPGSVARHGVWGYARERLIRLGIPLVFYVFVLAPITIALAHVARGEDFGDTLQRLWRQRVFDTGPLWFAEALLIFGAAYLVWRALWPGARGGGAVPFPSNALLLGAALATAAGAFALRLIVPLGHDVLGLQIGFFASYIVLFAAGCAGAAGAWLSAIPPRQRHVWGLVACGAAPLLPLTMALSPKLDGFAGGLNPQALIYAFWEPFVAWGIILWLVTWFPRRFSTLSPLWRTLTRRAYTMYVIHPPILVSAALVWRTVAAPALLKFVVTGAVACVVCYVVAGVLLRVRVLQRVL